MFQLNIEVYPPSSNAFDSLGEAYVDDGNNLQAIASCRRAIRLNPNNRSFVERFRNLALTDPLEDSNMMLLLPIHILAASLALVSGALAMFAAKGGKLHRKSGMAFIIAMLVMASSAVLIAAFWRPNRLNVIAGMLTIYLVSTALLTVRRPVEQARGLVTGFMMLALAGSAYAFALGFTALHSAGGKVDGMPPQPLFVFAVVGLVGGLLDARILLARSIQGAHRLVRHLWRMVFAMWIATMSFFLGQAQVFPEPLRKAIGVRAIPVVLVLAFLLYWLVCVLVLRRRAVNDILGRTPSARPSAALSSFPAKVESENT